MIFEREYQLTCLCCNRPELRIYLAENNLKNYIGKIINPFNCCTLAQQIFNQNDEQILSIEGTACQLGVTCKAMPCENCQKAVFKIKDKNKNTIGHINKKSPGCFKSAFSDADNFSLLFPKNYIFTP